MAVAVRGIARTLSLAAMLAGCLSAFAAQAQMSPQRQAQKQAPACDLHRSGVPEERLRALAKGFNLSGWFEQVDGEAPDMAVLRSLRRLGMTHIRLPIGGTMVIPELSSDERAGEALRRLDQALAQLNALGFTVSVDLHFGGEFSKLYKNDPAAAERMLEVAWTGLARVVASHPPGGVLAELLNEPEIDSDAWQAVAERLVAFVRARLPRTTLIVGPTSWQRADSMPGLTPFDDSNIVYALHFYSPMLFTHQGHWNDTDPLSRIRGLPFPFSAKDPAVDRLRQNLVADARNSATGELALKELDNGLVEGGSLDQIASDLKPAVEWQQRHQRPIIINEFGVLKGGAPPQARQRWLGAVVAEAERHCWGWTHWEYAAGFGLLGADGKPDAQTLRSLLGARAR